MPSSSAAKGNDSFKARARSRSSLKKLGGDNAGMLEPEPTVTIEALCCELLLKGFVNSYVDFFYLMQKPEMVLKKSKRLLPNKSEEVVVQSEAPPRIYSPEEMQVVKDKLCRAEIAQRAGNPQDVSALYSELADYFSTLGQETLSVYFYQKCLEIAELLDDVDLKIAANAHLGLVHHKLGNSHKSVEYHENQLKLALSCPISEHVVVAEKSLFRAYVNLAEDLKQSGSADDGSAIVRAVSVLKKCLSLSTLDMEEIEHAAVFLKLGELLVLSQASEAVEPLTKYLSFCKGKQLITEEGRACAALAAAYEKLGKLDESAEQLNAAMAIANDTGDLKFQARTAKRLGAVYTLQGDHAKAVKSFELNHSLNEQLLANLREGEDDGAIKNVLEGLDTARMLVGISKATSTEKDYLGLVQNDVNKLILRRNQSETTPIAPIDT